MGKEIKQTWLLKPGAHYVTNCMDSRHNPSKSQQNQGNLEQNTYEIQKFSDFGYMPHGRTFHEYLINVSTVVVCNWVHFKQIKVKKISTDFNFYFQLL